MKIKVTLTKKEIAFLKAIATKKGPWPNRISKAQCDDSFRKEWKEEIEEFKNNGLLIVGNPDLGGEYEAYYYKLNALGKQLQKQYKQVLV